MELRIADKYRICGEVGSGSFGEIYAGVDIDSGEKVAIKFEKLKTKHPHLLYESKIYRALQGGGRSSLLIFLVY